MTLYRVHKEIGLYKEVQEEFLLTSRMGRMRGFPNGGNTVVG